MSLIPDGTLVEVLTTLRLKPVYEHQVWGSCNPHTLWPGTYLVKHAAAHPRTDLGTYRFYATEGSKPVPDWPLHRCIVHHYAAPIDSRLKDNQITLDGGA